MLTIDRGRSAKAVLQAYGAKYVTHQQLHKLNLATITYDFVWIKLDDRSETDGLTDEGYVTNICAPILHRQVSYIITALVGAVSHKHHQDLEWRKSIMDRVEAKLDRKSTKITATANRKWTPLVYRCISSQDLEIPQKLEDFHSSYGRKGENVETRYSIRRLNAALLRFMENQPSDGCKNPDQGEYSKEGSAERRMGTEPIRSTDGPTDRAHGTPAKAEAPVCLQGSGPGQLEFGRSQRQSHLATPDKPSFSRASAAGVTQTQDCAAPAVARQQSGEMDTQGDSRQPDSEGTLKDSEQPFDKSTNLVSSGPRCSVVADEVDS